MTVCVIKDLRVMLAYFTLLATTAWAGEISHRNVLRYIIFFIPNILIVGFKYEVGFDWFVYTEHFSTFYDMPADTFFRDFWSIVAVYAQEPLYILLSFLGAKTLGSYEIYCCIWFIFFVYSIARLARILSADYVSSFLIIHFFLLFTLEFSTLRQMIALSTFNLGLALTLEGRKLPGLIFLAIAPFIQASTTIFIFVLLIMRATRRVSKLILAVSVISALMVSAIGVDKLAQIFSFIAPALVSQKLTYYAEVREYQFNILEVLFSLKTFSAFALLSQKGRRHDDANLRFLSTFTMYLIFIAIAGFAIATIRNRMLYEIVIIGSLIISSRKMSGIFKIRASILAMGAFFFFVSVVKSTSFMYVPYQNYIWHKMWDLRSDGPERQDRLNWMLRNK